MFRLLRLTVLLSVGFISAAIIARLIGTTQTATFAALFTRPDGSACAHPCLLGVMPGETTAEDAIDLIETHPLTRNFDIISIEPFRMEGKADRLVSVTFGKTPDGMVDEVTLASFNGFTLPADEMPLASLPDLGSLGDIVSRFGSPDFIQIVYGGDPVVGYKQATLAASVSRTVANSRRIDPENPVRRLTLFRMDNCPPTAFTYNFPRWLGLASFQRYSQVGTVETLLRRLTSVGVSYAPCRP